MSLGLSPLIPPRILVLDDERQIHASLRLRLVDICEPICHSSPRAALAAIEQEAFDLCIVDIHMAEMDGLTFISAAQQIDPALGFIILTGYDSEENLRRAIPLRTYDLLTKPLPNREGFEKRIPEWINRTRLARRDSALASESGKIGPDLDIARIERDVEQVASESARAALLQTANLLSTLQALLLSASHTLEKNSKGNLALAPTNRSLQEARRIAESAATVAEGYFNSAYADRENSPAFVAAGLNQAVEIALRVSKAEEAQKAIDLHPPARDTVATEITGIDLLLLLVPALNVALQAMPPASTLQIHGSTLARLDVALKDPRQRAFLWVNRKHAALSHAAVAITLRSSAPAPESGEAHAWLQGESSSPIRPPSRSLLHVLQKSRGVLGLGVKPEARHWEMVLVLPT